VLYVIDNQRGLAVKFVTLILISFLLVGCATHKSPLSGNSEEKYIFVTNNEKAIFQAAHESMIEGVHRSDPEIDTLTGDIRGFTTTIVFLVDFWTSKIQVIPTEAVTPNGEKVFGYYPEVSGGGTLALQGPAMDIRIYQAALAKFSQIGKKQVISEFKNGQYLFEPNAWRSNATIPQQPDNTIEERLKKIEALKNNGQISENEYKTAREKILNDL
jgi:hypothetical protein